MNHSTSKNSRPPSDGRAAIELPGFSYLPRFIGAEESEALIEFFGAKVPLWEQRFRDQVNRRPGAAGRRLTRPVYWLGAWQFACLGYYAEPDHLHDRCLRAEPLPNVMTTILNRLRPTLRAHQEPGDVPNTCLINYYGRELGDGPPRDYARLRAHRDGEPGPVVMFSIGQPGLLEFIDPTAEEVELAVWTRHRSVCVLSGANFKDRLYHRITQVRTGDKPKIPCRVDRFETRRVSVSFRHVPSELIADFVEMSPRAQVQVLDYVETLAESSEHFRAQLASKVRLLGV